MARRLLVAGTHTSCVWLLTCGSWGRFKTRKEQSVSAGGDDDTDENSTVFRGAIEGLQTLSCDDSVEAAAGGTRLDTGEGEFQQSCTHDNAATQCVEAAGVDLLVSKYSAQRQVSVLSEVSARQGSIGAASGYSQLDNNTVA